MGGTKLGGNSEKVERAGAAGTRTVFLAAIVLSVLAVFGVFVVFQFVDTERQRDLRAWQVRMGIVADSRLGAVEEWLERQRAQVRDLADNASLQLYMTELSLAAGDPALVTEEPAQRTYLRNLLTARAEVGGFTAPIHGPEIDANVSRQGVAGIALVGNDGRAIVATEAMPTLNDEHMAVLSNAQGKAGVIDLYQGLGGQPTIGVYAPVFGVQSDRLPTQQIGMVVGLKEVPTELYPLLEQPGTIDETAEIVLLRATETVVEYLSPLADGTSPMKREMALDTLDLAAAFSVNSPGGFGVMSDYRGTEVLTLSRANAAVPWVLMYKIDTAEALAETNARLGRLLTVLLLAVGAVAIALVAAWWQGTSRRATEAATRAEDMAKKFEEGRNFLQTVTESQPNAMTIIGSDGNYQWANREAWSSLGLTLDQVVGKPVAAVIGPVPAKKITGVVEDVLDHGAPRVTTHTEDRAEKTHTFQSEFIPLPATEEASARVLVISQDVTPTLEEREKRERIMNQLISTLVRVVDRRDPHASNHSGRVAEVAKAIAEDMELGQVEVETVEIAGQLMNLGKILVPQDLLTRTGKLTEAELKQVRGSILTSAEMLEGVEFEGPVVETLRQLQEHWDGGGTPAGLKGEEILITGRIVAVANAFVAMVSSRSFRPGASFDDALERLLSLMGKDFDRRVVLALAHYLDNQGGRKAWAHYGEQPDEDS